MDAILLNGHYTATEAEQLFGRFLQLNADFYAAATNTARASETATERAQQTIRELENEMCRIVKMVKAGNHEEVAIVARVVLEFCPRYHSV